MSDESVVIERFYLYNWGRPDQQFLRIYTSKRIALRVRDQSIFFKTAQKPVEDWLSEIEKEDAWRSLFRGWLRFVKHSRTPRKKVLSVEGVWNMQRARLPLRSDSLGLPCKKRPRLKHRESIVPRRIRFCPPNYVMEK
jgi:hypothetical protein